MHSLVLDKGDGILFNRIYNLACIITDPAKSKALSNDAESGDNDFWQSAFEEMGGSDLSLVSAILQTLSVPFGAYALTSKTVSRLEITPWILSDKKIALEMFDKAMASDADAEALYSMSRSLTLTADFLTWLKNGN